MQKSIAGTPSHLPHLALGNKQGGFHRASHRIWTSAGPSEWPPQRTSTRGRPNDLRSCANRTAPTRVLTGAAEPPPPPPRLAVPAPELDFCLPAASLLAHRAPSPAFALRRSSRRGPRTPRPDAPLADRGRPRAAGPGRGSAREPDWLRGGTRPRGGARLRGGAAGWGQAAG